MRLINVRTLAIEQFFGSDIPPYAILSHTWGTEEVTFQDWQDISLASSKSGFAKILGACEQATRSNLDYIWVDTNCIDKTSSAELSEAINSMWAWYRDASICYAYLADAPDTALQVDSDGGVPVDWEDPFWQSKWFTRGWTLQELLAPQDLIFYSVNWLQLGTKKYLKDVLRLITGINFEYLDGSLPVWQASVAERMSWMSKRLTTRDEDMAYCMLGIFEINMPLLYGEGSRAFLRLQEEILKVTDDQTIFCWEWNRTHVADDWVSILAPCPAVFEFSSNFYPTVLDNNTEVVPYSITNVGLSIKLRFIETADPNFVCGILSVNENWVGGNPHQVCIPLQKSRIYHRLPFPTSPFSLHVAMAGKEKAVYITSGMRIPTTSPYNINAPLKPPTQPTRFDIPSFDVGFLLTFDHSYSSSTRVADLRYCTSDVRFVPEQSLLGFSFDPGDTNEKFAAAILQLNHAGPDIPLILLAVRRCKDLDSAGVRGFRYYCQAVPRALTKAVAVGLPLSEIVQEAETNSLRIERDIELSSNKIITVALGELIPYSSFNRQDWQPQLVHIVSIMRLPNYRAAELKKREGKEGFSFSLLSVDGQKPSGILNNFQDSRFSEQA
jgi:hypothetical protein